ncbi:MAG: CRTAC1 family protein, partial [Verrucomicrobiales bacterium]
DFDSDGDLDLFVGGRVVPGSYPLAAESRLLRNSGGDFEDVTDQLAPGLRDAGMVTGALWSDADGDGLCDLLVTYEWGPVRLFKNEAGQLSDQTEAAGLVERSGWWNGISGGDFDNDGDIDYVITNFGLNTKYKASPERPTFLYYGDFEGDGRMRLVEAEFENETLYPVRGRSCSSEAMPFLLDKFDSYKGFAIASVEEIYSPENLEASIRFEATELRSGILLNDGGGSFGFQPLPRIAQIAPGFGSSVCDFDGDGNLDLYIVQNFFHPQAETGRMAGGVSQLLRGLGDGRFSPVGPAESGLVVPGDAKSLAQVDLDSDGRPDFLVGINASAPELFLNRTGGERLTVKLIGDAGNPSGIGARVEIQAESGASRSAEVYAGSGYLSQSSAPLQFGGISGPYMLKVRWGDGTITEINGTELTGLIEVRKGGGK